MSGALIDPVGPMGRRQAYVQALNGNAPPNYAAPPDASGPGWADAYTSTTGAISDWLQKQRAISVAQGKLDPNTGWPTQAGWADAGQQYAQSLLMGSTAPAAKVPGITAFHGSPHDFDAFDASKIGTGEGNQMYGHGLYFAESPGVAQSYRDALAGPPTPWELSHSGEFNPFSIAAPKGGGFTGMMEALQKHQGDFDAAIKDSATPDEMKGALQLWQSKGVDFTPSQTFGRMYEVNIAADPAHFLDWDKPLSEQSQHVQDALSKAGVPVDKMPDWSAAYYQPKTAEQSQALQDAGIPGIRYLDQGSRGKGQGTSNYVVFDPSIISIARKYAVPAAVLSGTGAGLVQQGQQSQ